MSLFSLNLSSFFEPGFRILVPDRTRNCLFLWSEWSCRSLPILVRERKSLWRKIFFLPNLTSKVDYFSRSDVWDNRWYLYWVGRFDWQVTSIVFWLGGFHGGFSPTYSFLCVPLSAQQSTDYELYFSFISITNVMCASELSSKNILKVTFDKVMPECRYTRILNYAALQ